MSELLFILVTVYVAYVVYTSVNDKPMGGQAHAASTAAPAKTEPKSAVKEAAKPAAEKTAKVSAPVVETVAKALSDELKNPKTGEVSKVPNNYRFGKRWIKDALVAEGLLDKVYKNNELDNAATSEKVEAALTQLRSIKKYQV